MDVVASGAVGSSPEGESQDMGPRTYAQMAWRAKGQTMSPHCARAVMRAQLRAKQIFVDGLVEEGDEPLTAAVLVAKPDKVLRALPLELPL